MIHHLSFAVERLPHDEDDELIVISATCTCGRRGTYSVINDGDDDGETEIDRDCPALIELDQGGWPSADELP